MSRAVSDNGFQPTTDAGAVLTAALAVSTEWVSKWMPRGGTQPTVLAHFYGSQAATIYIEETWDPIQIGTPTVHNAYSLAATLNSILSKYTATLEYRLVAPAWRVRVVNGGTIQSGAKLFAASSSF